MARTYVALDLETTGLDSRQDEIIEVGAVKFQDDQVLETFHSLVKPRRPLPYAIQLLTGITTQDVQDAPPFAVIAGDLLLFLSDCPLVAHNAPFDLAFLTEQGLELPNPCYDTLELVKVLLPHLPERNLTALAKHFDIPYPVRHRALSDATAAKELFLALQGRAQALDHHILIPLCNLASAGWSLSGFFQDTLAAKLEPSAAGAGQPIPSQGPPPTAVASPAGKEAPERPDSRETGVEERRLLDLEALARFLGPQGRLSRALSGFEHRPEQVAMMGAVAEAFNNQEHLFAEAGTGTGKSLAYLLPAVCYAVQNNTRVVVSTNTINLQEQIVTKDIPLLLQALALAHEDEGASLPKAEEVRVAQLKGRGNYLCPRRWNALAATAPTNIPPSLYARILIWLGSTPTGDRAELNLTSSELSQWDWVSAQTENCPALQCQMLGGKRCFLQRARQRAAEAHLLVVNHALLVSDMSAGSKILPEYDYLIVDEAHHLEDVATDQLGLRLGPWDFTGLLDRMSQEVAGGRRQGFLASLESALRAGAPLFATQGGLLEHLGALQARIPEVRRRLGRLFDVLVAYLRQHGEGSAEYGRRLRLTGGARRQPLWSQVEQAWEDSRLTLEDVRRQLEYLHTGLTDLPEASLDQQDDFLAETVALHATCQEHLDRAHAVLAQPHPEWVYWLASTGQTEGVILCGAPIEVGPILNEELFSKKAAVVLTSATLRTGGNFEYVKGRLGLERPKEVAVESSFPYREAALLVIPEDVPEPQRVGHGEAVERALADLCAASQGRALALFTSHAALQSAHRTLSQLLEPQGIRVLAQGVSGAPHQLLEALRSEARAVLLGTSSFWEGVDVVGEALSLLVITRLPFTVPTEPVFAARSEGFEDPFGQYAVPQAVLRFRQGFGRLIRSKSDRGVVVVLDSRIASKNYGTAFLASLPPVTTKRCTLREAPRIVAQWLQPFPHK